MILFAAATFSIEFLSICSVVNPPQGELQHQQPPTKDPTQATFRKVPTQSGKVCNLTFLQVWIWMKKENKICKNICNSILFPSLSLFLPSFLGSFSVSLCPSFNVSFLPYVLSSFHSFSHSLACIILPSFLPSSPRVSFNPTFFFLPFLPSICPSFSPSLLFSYLPSSVFKG
ncbi:hypothetical protein ILYODFUR_029637 [Ilyodon furcidens]|uniref:Uncharacterized protein n=1 Tax=Ilyodon furcidens TaxID=33524 RepID=A0ABV0TMR9_9TELE